MFDSGLDARGTLDALTRLRRERLERECAELELVAQWGHLTSTERGIGEFASMERGAVLATTTTAADRLLADATDLRARWPHLWALVRAGSVPAWKVRKTSQAARHLGDEAVGRLDAELDGLVCSLPWTRYERVLDATIIAVDPARAEKEAEQWEAEQFVRTGQTRGHGLKLLVARAAAGDVIWFMAMVNRIAEILLVEGDHDPVDRRRARAIGILAQPALALQLLARHRPSEQGAPADAVVGSEGSACTAGDGGADRDRVDRDLADRDLADRDLADRDLADRDRADLNCADLDRVDLDRDDLDEIESAPEPIDLHRSVRFDVPGADVAARLDPARVAPKVVLHIHLSREALTSGAGVARFEGVGPVTVKEVRDFLGSRTCRIRVQPVLDPDSVTPVDAYEIPTRLAESLRHRHPVEVFPFGTQPSRSADLDHTIAYRPLADGGPPGQTALDNLGPLGRRHHRAKTFGGWAVRQPEPGVYLWRSPCHFVYHVDHHGTHPLGNGAYAQAVWRTVTRRDRARRARRARRAYEKVA